MYVKSIHLRLLFLQRSTVSGPHAAVLDCIVRVLYMLAFEARYSILPHVRSALACCRSSLMLLRRRVDLVRVGN